jgi:hypothetical protein
LKPSTIITTVALFAVISCAKDQTSPNGISKNPSRKVRFELYTNEEFAGDQHNILFSIQMSSGQRTIFDSALATMKVQDIPDSSHRIIIEKTVPDNDSSALKVGFTYQIENVGTSWYLDSFPAKDTFKLVKYAFR